MLFDLDGTLLDTLEDLADSMNAVLAARGYPTHPVAAYTVFVGDGMRNLVRRSLPQPEASDDAIVDALVPLTLSEYARRWKDKTHLYDGIQELLDFLSVRGIAKAVLSNKPHSATVEVVDHFLSRWGFDAVFGARPGVPIKPDAGAALEVSRKLKVEPGSFWYVGDTNTDMQTARAAGMYAVGVLWGFRDENELHQSGAAVVVRSPRDIVRMLEQA